MSLCSNIKFHGYLIVVFSALLTTTVLISSVILKLMYGGTETENRFCLIPFLVSIVFDWIAYLVANTRDGSALPYQVWLVTTAIFLYVFVTLIGLYRLFQIKSNEGANRSEEFNKTICL
uniref:Uncharacterized protein n=1 Tax=Anopheles atroparvus TaxID=41427 RepID=A0A182JJV9_ANOAO